MKFSRIYYQGNLAVGEIILLSEEASRHLMQVLRAKVSQSILVFNGNGHEYLGKVAECDKKSVKVKVLQKREVNRESPLLVELAQGISRGGRMEYAIQKSVELGVGIITPILTERCNINEVQLDKKMSHWGKIIVSACEQSGRVRIPVLNRPLSLKDWLAQEKSEARFVCVPDGDIVSAQISTNKVHLLVGPEGGLSSSEVKAAYAAKFEALRLGRGYYGQKLPQW